MNALATQKQPPFLLVVEDDRDVRETLVEVLTEEGFRVVSFPGGQAALAFLKETQDLPEVILLDLMMPGMDGWQVRKEQMADPRLSSIPCVIVSADGKFDERTRGLTTCVFLRKPVHIKALLNIVGQYLQPGPKI